MPEFLSLQETALYVHGQPRIPEVVLQDILSANNNEFKILCQSPLVEGKAVPIVDVAGIFPGYTSRYSETASYDQVYTNIVDMDDNFVRVWRSPDSEPVAVQSKEGHRLSAPIGGHLLKLAVDSEVSLRSLMAEKTPPRESRNGELGRSAIEARLILLTELWRSARENWQPSRNIIGEVGERGVSDRQARSHMTTLADIGILERRKPDHKLPTEQGQYGRMVRLAQEGGPMPPIEIVERYLSIVLLASVTDPEFIAAGLKRLGQIRRNTDVIPELVRRSFSGTKHVGKSRKNRP